MQASSTELNLESAAESATVGHRVVVASSDAASEAPVQAPPPTLQQYAGVTASLAAFGTGLYWICAMGAAEVPSRALLGPMWCMGLLIAVVWTMMAVVRNFAILTKVTSGTYYLAYNADHPPDWVERPARVFNNLMQLPMLLFIACILTMMQDATDKAQWMLAWAFVATRIFHAVVYIGWNYVPARFGSYVAGAITLTVLWYRMAQQI